MSEFFVTANHVDESGNLGAAVHVLVELALSLEAHEAAEAHVLADLAHEGGTDLLKRLAVQLESGKSGNVGGSLLGNQADGVLGHLLELGILGDEVGLGIGLENTAGLAVVGDEHRDDAFGRDAGGSLGCLVAQLHAQNL